MDFFAHGFWTNALYEVADRRNKKPRSAKGIWLPIFFGVAPDMFSFGVLLIANVFTSGTFWPERIAGDHSFGPPDPSRIPAYVHTLYNFTHSFVVFAAIFLLVWLFRKAAYLPMAGWGLHILIDIYSHTDAFFPTPILFPFSKFHVSGISWANPWFMAINYGALALTYFTLYFRKRKNGIKESTGVVSDVA